MIAVKLHESRIRVKRSFRVLFRHQALKKKKKSHRSDKEQHEKQPVLWRIMQAN